MIPKAPDAFRNVLADAIGEIHARIVTACGLED